MEEQEEEALKQRLRERQMPPRRFEVGGRKRRHRVLNDEGVYVWEYDTYKHHLNKDLNDDGKVRDIGSLEQLPPKSSHRNNEQQPTHEQSPPPDFEKRTLTAQRDILEQEMKMHAIQSHDFADSSNETAGIGSSERNDAKPMDPKETLLASLRVSESPKPVEQEPLLPYLGSDDNNQSPQTEQSQTPLGSQQSPLSRAQPEFVPQEFILQTGNTLGTNDSHIKERHRNRDRVYRTEGIGPRPYGACRPRQAAESPFLRALIDLDRQQIFHLERLICQRPLRNQLRHKKQLIRNGVQLQDPRNTEISLDHLR
jgi:hypothetical protein